MSTSPVTFRWDFVVIFVIIKFLQGGGAGSMGLLNNLRSFFWIKVQQYTTREVKVCTKITFSRTTLFLVSKINVFFSIMHTVEFIRSPSRSEFALAFESENRRSSASDGSWNGFDKRLTQFDPVPNRTNNSRHYYRDRILREFVWSLVRLDSFSHHVSILV